MVGALACLASTNSMRTVSSESAPVVSETINKGAGDAAPKRVSVVVGCRRAHPSVAPGRAPARCSGPSAGAPRSATPRTATMRASSVLPNAKSPLSAVEAAPPHSREPWPRATAVRYSE